MLTTQDKKREEEYLDHIEQPKPVGNSRVHKTEEKIEVEKKPGLFRNIKTGQYRYNPPSP